MAINFDANQLNLNTSNNAQDANKTVLTKQQFTNSIMSALSNAGANSQQIQNFSQQATSIFNQYDANGDSKWSQQEANNGGASALSNFYQTVNNALKGVGATDGVNQVNQTSDVSGSNAAQEIKTPTAQEIQNSATMDALKQDLQDIQSCGYKVSMGSDGVIQLQGQNGETGTIKINDDGSLELTGCAETALQQASEKAGAREEAMGNLDSIEAKYSQQHGEAVDVKPETRTVNGQEQKVGVMTFQDGTEVMFDLKTGKEIEE